MHPYIKLSHTHRHTKHPHLHPHNSHTMHPYIKYHTHPQAYHASIFTSTSTTSTSTSTSTYLMPHMLHFTCQTFACYHTSTYTYIQMQIQLSDQLLHSLCAQRWVVISHSFPVAPLRIPHATHSAFHMPNICILPHIHIYIHSEAYTPK